MPNKNLVSQVQQLKAQQDAFQAMLVADLSALFGIPVSGVEGYTVEGQVETGTLISGEGRYRFRVDGAAGVKELTEA